MEIEVTFEEFLKFYPPLKTDFSKLLPKSTASELKYFYRPPFLILHDDEVEPSDVYTNTLLDIYEMLQNQEPGFRHKSFYLMDSQFYVTKFSENQIEIKDGTDRGMLFVGPFEAKMIIPAAAFGNFNNKKMFYGKQLLQMRESISEYQAKQNK